MQQHSEKVVLESNKDRNKAFWKVLQPAQVRVAASLRSSDSRAGQFQSAVLRPGPAQPCFPFMSRHGFPERPWLKWSSSHTCVLVSVTTNAAALLANSGVHQRLLRLPPWQAQLLEAAFTVAVPNMVHSYVPNLSEYVRKILPELRAAALADLLVSSSPSLHVWAFQDCPAVFQVCPAVFQDCLAVFQDCLALYSRTVRQYSRTVRQCIPGLSGNVFQDCLVMYSRSVRQFSRTVLFYFLL